MEAAARGGGHAAEGEEREGRCGESLDGLWWDREFSKLWVGETVSLFGTQITLLALPLAAVSLGASAFEMGALRAAQWLPFLLLALPAGLWVERRRKRPVLVLSNLGQAALFSLVPLLAFCGVLGVGHLVAVAFAAGVCALFFEVAYHSYLPRLVRREDLVEANGKLMMSMSVSEVGGPGLGGALVGLLTAPFALLFDALSFLFAAAALWRIKRPEPEPPLRQRAEGGAGGAARELLEGFRATWGNRYLLAFAGEAATYNVFWSAMEAVLLLWAVKELGFTAGMLGLLLAVGSCGAVLGAALTKLAARNFGAGTTMIGSAIVSNVGTLLIPLAPALVAALAPGRVASLAVAAALGTALFLRGVGMTGCNVQVYAARQAITPDYLMGRVNAVYTVISRGFVPVGALLGGVLGEAIGLRPALIVGASGLFFSWAWLFFSPARSLRDPASLTPAAPAGDPNKDAVDR